MAKKKQELYIISITATIILFIHCLVSIYHFHEVDSSLVYKTLKQPILKSFSQIIHNLDATSPIFLSPLRAILGLLTQYIPIQPIKSSLQLSLSTTYPPLEGLVYGIYLPETLSSFYNFASFINAVIFLSSSLLLYLLLKRYNTYFISSFIFSFGMTCIYSINAYSYHLGSTLWFIFSSCLSLYSIGCLKGRKLDLGLAFAALSGYPSILLFTSKILTDIFSTKIKSIKSLIELLFKRYKYSLITNFFIMLFLFPYGSSFRTEFDWRGLFTQFAIFSQGDSIDTLSFTISTIVFLMSLLAIINYLTSFRDNKSLSNLQKDKFTLVKVILLYLVFIILLILTKNLTFSTSRHNLFILPILFTTSGIGFDLLLKNLFARIITSKIQYFLSVSVIAIGIIISSYSSIERLDPLKTSIVPVRIRNFAHNYSSDKITLIDLDYHYLYNDFTTPKALYNRIEPLKNLHLSHLGKRLIVTQRVSGPYDLNIIKNADENLKKGDKLITNRDNLEVTLLEDPYIIRNKVYFDSMNYNRDGINQEQFPYSRPNSIYIFPVDVTAAKKTVVN